MDLEVVGRHALLFDDDSMAAFVNSADALVDWNSLSIDRYDVRHLLSAPPPPRTRRRHHPLSPNPDDDALQSELDHERYLDLSSSSVEQDLENGEGSENPSGYNAVGFSYGPTSGSSEQNTDVEPGFRPPFSVPENLLAHLPPTEKVHQIIAKTAIFVSKHGGQSEIVLRVKQGDNPTFGFLLPDHNLHPYFRLLVDNKELLESDIDGKSTEEENKTDTGQGQGVLGGALSLLGSVYGTGEDEEAATENAPALTKTDSTAAVNTDNVIVPHESGQNNSSNPPGKDDTFSRHSIPALKERSQVIKRNRSISELKSMNTAGIKKDGDTMGISATMDKLQRLVSSKTSKVEQPILEPPTDMKRVIEKIVEFILRNGKEFEVVLVQQDTKHGRFPFLLPSHPFHSYYLNILQKAEEAKSTGKSFSLDKLDTPGHRMDKKSGSREEDTQSASDIPNEPDRKEKFKMVLGNKSKKDGQDPPSKAASQPVGVSVDAVVAILQAARKGIKNPNLEILSKTMTGSNGSQKPDTNGDSSDSIAKGIANETDSSEAREQKLKAERLKRAKMFAAMVKSGAAQLKTEPLRGLSVEPSESGSDSQAHLVGLERASSSVVDSSDKTEKPGKNEVAEHNERRLKRSYRSRSKRTEEAEEEDEEDSKQNGEHKHSQKKRHRRSHRSKDRHKHRKRHSSTQGLEKRDSSPEDGHRHRRRRHRLGSSNDDERRHSRHDDEHRRSRRRHKHDTSSDEERGKSVKQRKSSNSEGDRDLEEGEIVVKSDQSKASDCGEGGDSREASLDLSKSQAVETAEVSDELRAKIRAMLMATL